LFCNSFRTTLKLKCVKKDIKVVEKVRLGDDLNVDQKQKQHTISELLSTLRQFKGITRKSALGELLPILGENVYDDAGVLEIGSVKVVVSADGIVEDLVRDDPWLAGFYSVVVNVNDVVAKGARPLGYAHVLSSSSPSVRRQIVNGIKHGIDKYGLKFLKGHTHPDASYDAVDAAVVGVAQNIVSSATAKPNDHILVVIDLDGNFGSKSWVKTFDSVLFKTKKQEQTRLEAVIQLAEKKLVHACRDISGPGAVGTIAMLCESSRVGATINLDAIPKPENLELEDWLMTYPSTGFVLTTNRPKECIELLRSRELTANVVGTILKTKTIKILYQGQAERFMNLEKESIFGLKEESLAKIKVNETHVKELTQEHAPQIEVLLKKVWSTAYEYPEEWRKARILTKEQVLNEMSAGFYYFGVIINDKLVGVYKAIVADDGLLGEHQSVDPVYKGLGLATAMYHQFIRFAKENNCKKVYVNTLVNQAASIKILKKMKFRKRGQEYEQAKSMKVQTYEKDV